MSFVLKYDGKEQTFEKKVCLLSILNGNEDKKIIAAKVNNVFRELTYEVYYDAEIEWLTVASEPAMRMYEASLRYVVAMAFARCYPKLKIKFSYNVSRSISVNLLGNEYTANTAMLIKISHEIKNIVEKDIPLKRYIVPTNEAKNIFIERGFDDKLDILKYRPEKTVHLYSCEEYINYMYSHMVPSTGYITDFALRLYAPGFILQYPRAELGGKIPPFEDAPTFRRVLKEQHDWSKIISTDTVSNLNRIMEGSGPIDFINMSEARHNRELCELGQLIEDGIEDISLICIAGPSSSGKTTFANRLRIELLSRGIKPIRISLDDYYLTKDVIPLGEDGKPDLESIEALDIELFNQNMLDLINGEEVTLPQFNFQLGRRVPGRTIKIKKGEPIIIEGIHALNDLLTRNIPKSAKFKIFISPQAQINLDNHNPLSLTDLRLLRRIVRDYKFRGSDAEETLSMWPSVRRGEFKWIYPSQEGCDYVYNSMLPYELPVLKKHATPLLNKIDKNSPYYETALRLLRMLKFFVDLQDDWIPSNSLMREFIGGSCYADV